ncbi:hypothetical protein FPZ42_14300 [Mucilaginibacter achroorhodeus]|uniref:Tetratricopeptide repeat protein n=1 Tax=Mucilaginibacter achroorhodeus TaxID=2599294 RepID=A0A563TZX4_9SPHI|nr:MULTISPECIES: hypothetical protein [Mucilaginibacter]QXV65648.1 hypothetical protein INP83_00685 [Mucilaginibacter sp. 21P]TWR24926.1 hypothetical protein FPZ42_14300 [Mucilaginibacter achroorhodeus]
MLLGSNTTSPGVNHVLRTDFIVQLISQSKYAEAYQLLKAEPTDKPTTHYNLALCFYWTGNYREALIYLDKAQMFLPAGTIRSKQLIDEFYKNLRDKQNQLNDHQTAITDQYLHAFPEMVADGIIRLKTDCWLQLKEFAIVVETATPIAYKQYRNITEALTTAKEKLKK